MKRWGEREIEMIQFENKELSGDEEDEERWHTMWDNTKANASTKIRRDYQPIGISIIIKDEEEDEEKDEEDERK